MLAGDAQDREQTRRLVAAAVAIAPLRPGGAFYVCAPSGPSLVAFQLGLEDAGLQVRQSLVWVKHHFVLSRQDYHWRHESILYGWKSGAAHSFFGGRKQDTVWPIAQSRMGLPHPTTKPLALVRKALENSSQPGEIVFDGFGGSGTTLVACEGAGRVCRMLEVEPRFCDLILARWEQATGCRARRRDHMGHPLAAREVSVTR